MNAVYGIILFILSLIYGPEGIAQLPVEPGIAAKIDSTAHDYHGIFWSVEDETGKYFWRDGQRCQLLTKAFLKYYEKEKAK